MKKFAMYSKKSQNWSTESYQFAEGIEAFVLEGFEEPKMVFPTAGEKAKPNQHTHDCDEYIICLDGHYEVLMNGRMFSLKPGDELYISEGTAHEGKCVEGDTRTMHAFGGRRLEGEIQAGA